MGEKPHGKSIDRKNVHGNYEPSNCKWSTGSEQARNKRNNRIVIFNGTPTPLSVVEDATGRSRGALFQYLKRH